VTIHADARLWAGLFDGDESASLALDPARVTYVHLVRGALTVNGQRLEGGDAVTLSGEELLGLSQGQDAEVLVFDLKP
jgi:redox-sensitive bicupin YhaK (pirin superfamily)